MTETFKLKSVYVNSKFVRFLYPIVFLVVIIFVSSNQSIKFADTGFVALAGVALVIWSIFDVLKVMKLKKYALTIDEHQININEEYTLKWNEISAVTFYSAGFGMQEVITFNNDKKMKVPAVIENFEVLKNRIKNSVSEACVIEEK